MASVYDLVWGTAYSDDPHHRDSDRTRLIKLVNRSFCSKVFFVNLAPLQFAPAIPLNSTGKVADYIQNFNDGLAQELPTLQKLYYTRTVPGPAPAAADNNTVAGAGAADSGPSHKRAAKVARANAAPANAAPANAAPANVAPASGVAGNNVVANNAISNNTEVPHHMENVPVGGVIWPKDFHIFIPG